MGQSKLDKALNPETPAKTLAALARAHLRAREAEEA